MASSSSRSVKVTDINPHLLCVLCGGYYVDATTIIECLHSFCKSCIVRYLETNKYCPICDVQVHKSKPLLNIRSDRKLQAIVYKLVPGLFQRELNCRKEFYKHQLEAKCSSGHRESVLEESPVYPPGETLLLAVQYADSFPPHSQRKRYLRCPAAININHLQKLMRAKFDLNASQRVEFLHEGDLLPDHMSLMDLAYMYHWKRNHPIELEYRLLECQQKKIKLVHEEDNPLCLEAKKENSESRGIVEDVNNSSSDQLDREVQLQISENGVMSVQSVDSSSNNTVVSSKSECVNPISEASLPVKDIQLETMELMKSLGNDVTLSFDNSLAKVSIDDIKHNIEIPANNNNNTITNEISDNIDVKYKNFTKEPKEDSIKKEEATKKKGVDKREEINVDKREEISSGKPQSEVVSVSREVKNESLDLKESKSDSLVNRYAHLDENKSHTNKSSLSIIAVPPMISGSTPVHAQKVYPGAVKDPSNPMRHFKTKEVYTEVKKSDVPVKLVPDKPEPPKAASTARYKTLKSPIKPWNPTIPRSTIMAMKQAQAANQDKGDYPGKTTPKAPKFFKMRNVPRFLGNPASGVKPMYQVLPGSELKTQASQSGISQTSKPVSSNELTVMKIDPKTLTPITVCHSRSSKIDSSSSKPSTTLAPTTHKILERDLLTCGTPIRNPVSKNSSISSRGPSQLQSPGFPSNPFGLPTPHMLYPGFPRSFSPVDTPGNQLPADNAIFRAMSMLCSSGGGFHPSLPPSISMLLNPHHPHHRSSSDKLNFKYTTSDFHKSSTTTTPSVQRIPPSGPSSKISSSSSNNQSSASESFCPPSMIKELDKRVAEERKEHAKDEQKRPELFSPITSSTNSDQDTHESRMSKTSALLITNGLSLPQIGNLDKDFLKLNKQNVNANLCAKESTEQKNKEDNQRSDSKSNSDSNC